MNNVRKSTQRRREVEGIVETQKKGRPREREGRKVEGRGRKMEKVEQERKV